MTLKGLQQQISAFARDSRKFFTRKLTLMLVPHSTLRPMHLHVSVSFLLFLTMFWTGITGWAAVAVFSDVDYWSTRVNYQILKLKVRYFATELKKSRELVDQVREADTQLRKLLQMKNRQSILEQESQDGQGGVEPFERSILQKELTKRIWEISDEEIRMVSSRVQKESQEQLNSYKEITEHIAYERGLNRSTPRGWPTIGRPTSFFGARVSPFHGGTQFHTGVDIANEKGTPVRSTAEGIIQLANWEGGYGRLVIIDHGFGYLTYYGHNSALLVRAGEKVRRGQVIAYMGSSGSSTGNHSHYEVWKEGRPVDPWRYLAAQSVDELNSKGLARKSRQ